MDFSTLLTTTALDDTDEDDDEDEDDENDIDPTSEIDFSLLTVNGRAYDLRNPSDVAYAHQNITNCYQRFNEGKLAVYEGKSTEWHGGGKARMLYDLTRVELAAQKLNGEDVGNWGQQHANAMERIKFASINSQGKK